MFGPINKVEGVGVFVRERGFSSGPIVDDIRVNIQWINRMNEIDRKNYNN